MTVAAEQLSLMIPVAGLTPIGKDRANFLLAKWQHNLGPIGRPFGAQCWALKVVWSNRPFPYEQADLFAEVAG